MTLSEFNREISDTERATIIDLWAPWCGPCKAMKPAFDKLSEEYGDRARVLAVNADESSEVLQRLQVFAIPTVLAFRGGNEIVRRKGAQSEADLRALFEAVIQGKELPAMSNRTRFIRIAAAVAALFFSFRLDPAWPMQVFAAMLFGLAIHDRCPVLKALKRAFFKQSGETSEA